MAFLPILAISSIQVCRSVGLVERGGILGVVIDCSDMMSGFFMWVCEGVLECGSYGFTDGMVCFW